MLKTGMQDLLQSQQFTPATFEALIPTLWSAIVDEADNNKSGVFLSLLHFIARQPVNSALTVSISRFLVDCVTVSISSLLFRDDDGLTGCATGTIIT